MTIATQYQERCDTSSDINEHLPYFVETCVELDAKKVIELGVRDGNSTVAWLQGLELTDGRLWSVDPDGHALGTIPDDRWTFVLGYDTHPEVVALLPTSVDVVFIDTTHHYEQTLRELFLYAALVRPGGRVLLHDTELARPDGWPPTDPEYPVKCAIEKFCSANGLDWSNRPECYGIGTILIPE